MNETKAVHHADDHRTRALTVLGAQGIEGPDLDVWSHADRNGRVEPAGGERR